MDSIPVKNVDFELLKLKHPFSCILAGPSFSGKTTLVTNIINCLSEISTFENIKINLLWIYGQQESISNISFCQNINVLFDNVVPTDTYLKENNINIVVIDDLMSEACDDKALAEFFTKKSHHMKFSVFLLIQNLFYKSRQLRTISLNASYIIIMKNRRDLSQIDYIGRQLYPNNRRFFLDVYKDVTQYPFGYLLIDLKQTTPEEFRLRSNITDRFRTIIYMEK
ncbi:hypothetical protein B4U80_05101 [Leptotrombidium deliense]|uniref:AAA+ ATPase domain-containing protein n=1 Tax=Leptotrombidium deliense TaxID=299467 RepID=A0A443RWZ5_9ACAR|nr:hypothetical protein B4U80_05101 [Leptotrombidium deliense]